MNLVLRRPHRSVSAAPSRSGRAWEVLPQQSVEVVAAAALPTVVRIGEVAAYSGLFFGRLAAVELGTVIPGDGLERKPTLGDKFQGRAVHRSNRAVREFGDQRQARVALADGEKARSSAAPWTVSPF